MRLRRLMPERVASLVVWGAAAVIYIVVGVFVTDFLLSVFVCLAYLLLMVWLVPAAIRRVL